MSRIVALSLTAVSLTGFGAAMSPDRSTRSFTVADSYGLGAPSLGVSIRAGPDRR
ncbi:hypothetical protein Lfu02_69970 [Longispora fulva]|uniref:Uncharacterized protein n=1 Tax=Longispora fulva TaxID=619741 RepID=A0A8J7KDV3_9ACTN|nr:hypothetical protein [Longispora fulva]MBG6134460.1 hypothetical protein [Longispora fulva]GIG62625.1 hypothetical protein Lfu02_69970 [Longispora fulva]